MLLLGGFAYFDASDELLSVNAITLAPSDTGLVLVGPCPSDPNALAAMKQQGRMQNVTLSGLKGIGLRSFGWVHPAEKLSGGRLSENHLYDHGAFLYEPEPNTVCSGGITSSIHHSAVQPSAASSAATSTATCSRS